MFTLENYIMFKKSKTARVFAGVVGFMMVFAAFGAVSAPVSAQTTDLAALQALVASLQAQIAALSGGSSSSMVTGSNPIAPLTMGSSGGGVTQLQNFLISKGFGISAGATGYFGSQTTAALAAFQSANGISPAVGYYGSITEAKVAMMMGGTTGGGSTSGSFPAGCISTTGFSFTTGASCSGSTGSTGSTASGKEGQLVDIDNDNSDVESTLYEDEEDVKVFGVEFEAEDSEMTIDRVDVDFTLTDAADNAASSNLDDYITEVSLYHGDEKLATMDVDEADENDAGDGDFTTAAIEEDVYSFRFSGLDIIVDEGDKVKLHIAVSAIGNLDSDDADEEWAVLIPDDGIRATDGAGISETYVGSSDLDEENFSIEAADAGDLTLKTKSSDNEDRIVGVEKDVDTKGVEILRFTLESDSSDNWVDEIGLGFATTTATSTSFTQVFKKLTLFADGDEIASDTITNAATGTVLFDNLDLTIDEDKEIEFTVEADFNDVEDNGWDSYSFYAFVDASTIDAEDAEGDDVDLSTDADGGEIELRTSGIVVEFTGADETVKTGTVVGSPDSVLFKIKFSVTAIGDEDVYLDGDTVPAIKTPLAATNGLAWATTSDSSTGTTTGTYGYGDAILTADNGYESDDINISGNKQFLIESGGTRNFTFTVSVNAGGDNVAAGVYLTGFDWDTTSQDVMNQLYTFDLGDFTTDTITGLSITG